MAGGGGGGAGPSRAPVPSCRRAPGPRPPPPGTRSSSVGLRVLESLLREQFPFRQPRSTSPVVLHRSLRTRGLPPSASSAADASSSPATPPSPPKPQSTLFSSSLAASLCASADATIGDASAPAMEDRFDARRVLLLRPVDVRRVVPERILSVRILPLANRTVVAAGWDVDGLVEDEKDGDGGAPVF